ncbi:MULTISPECIES: hypothetical protein [unclassified Mesorhizobium]|uniref:hypothetical protein n=1 Tax=unclassified Mesorhizobium TaxID=325217 RepID=UPI0013C48DED|nr:MULTISPECIES: hypothetical protein [unclassified Mesorhizobium]
MNEDFWPEEAGTGGISGEGISGGRFFPAVPLEGKEEPPMEEGLVPVSMLPVISRKIYLFTG